jgi:D-sedoheptulose 7-phosphate isomerase
MSSEPLARLQSIFRETAAAHERFAASELSVLVLAADAISRSLDGGGKLLAFGNGGSASDAQHLVTELVGRFEIERRALPGVALTADSNVVTSIANDYGYEAIFTRQIEGLGRPGDVAFGISTSGRSPNVLAALVAARKAGLVTIALTGRDGGPIGAAAEIHINVAGESTPRVQEVQRTILHALCSLVEGRLADRA